MVHTEVDPRDPELRIQRLLDPGTVSLLVERTDCGMVAATGAIKGNRVVVFASDATIKSGALGVDGSHVIVSAYREAMAKQLPIIGIWHSGGARLRDGVAPGLGYYGAGWPRGPSGPRGGRHLWST